MAVNKRAARISALQKVAKKNYQPVKAADRTVLEHMLYACCLEDATFDAADIAFARLQQAFFDWNEVRVTTTVELAEIMKGLPDPVVAATRLKRTLHSMFETWYSFDIDHLRKENLGKAVQKMEKFKGITPFVVAYVAQNALGGHAIAVDQSALSLMYTVGVIDEKERDSGQVPGLERAVPKSKGVEFFSTVHQMAVAWFGAQFNKTMRDLLLTVDKDAAERFPKRARKKVATKSATSTAKKKTATKSASKPSPTKKKADSGSAGSAASKKKAAQKTATKRATAPKAAAAKGKKKKAGGNSGSTKKAKRTTTTRQDSKSPARRLSRKKPR